MRTAWLLLAFSLSGAAQPIAEGDAARARRLLSSPQWQDKAWGAYFAGRLHSADLEQPLLDAFREAAVLRDVAWGTEEFGYLTALFDAAIESEMAVPSEVLRPFEEKWPDPVVILLARGGEREESLLRIREEKLSEGQWLAVNNLLLALKSQPFFARTLREVNLSHQFTVTDRGDFPNLGRERAAGCGEGVLSMPLGFPPVGEYALRDTGTPGDVLLAAGPKNAYYRRVVVPAGGQAASGYCGGLLHRDDLRIGYLTTLSVLSKVEVWNLFRASTRIEFRGDADLRQRLESAITSQEAAIRAFVRIALEKGLGTVAGMKLQIVSEIWDVRKIKGRTPSLAPREFVLE